MITLNYRDARPIYEQVRDGLRRLIVSGAIADGEKLPSVRALASQLAINPNTIQRAYSELESEGYAASVPGKGSFAVRRERAEDDGRRLALTETLRETLRELRALGLDCAVAAVSRMQRPAADARRKNDRRDAEFIARMLATHNIVEVPLPDMAVEAARDLDRALDDATRELRRSRQRLNMFLIRLGHVWDERNADGARKKAWTRAHWRWVSEIRLEGPQRDALEYYVTAARCAESDRRQLERRVVALAGTDRWRATVEALSCIARFATASGFAAWVGLVPSEHSSGESRFRGGITKAGNALARTALIESAWHYSTCSPRPKAPAPGTDVPPAIRSRADDCTARLHRRREALAAAGKSACKANAAVARELACWVWEIGCRSEGTVL